VVPSGIVIEIGQRPAERAAVRRQLDKRRAAEDLPDVAIGGARGRVEERGARPVIRKLLVRLFFEPGQIPFARCLHRVLARDDIARAGPGRQHFHVVRMQ
jgi:hypothetical protein